jgi:hypothetical protein
MLKTVATMALLSVALPLTALAQSAKDLVKDI